MTSRTAVLRQDNVVAVDENVLIPTTGGLRLACKLWTIKGKPHSDHDVRIIAYPGWLDNSGSFDIPAEMLVRDYGFCVLAVDPPGCGLSDHRPPSSIYVDYDEAPMVADIADEMGWESFGIMGHSRGGGVCALASGLLQHRVKVFICVDSYFSLSGLWIDDLMSKQKNPAVKKMLRAREMAKKNLRRDPRVFTSFDEALEANMTNPWFKKSEATARNIVKRHLRPCAHGYTFTHDTRTYGQIAWVHLNESTLEDFLSSITAPTLQFLDNTRWVFITQKRADVMEKLQSWRRLIKPGVTVIEFNDKGHHLHSDAAREFVDVVGPFVNQNWNKPTVNGSASKRAEGASALAPSPSKL